MGRKKQQHVPQLFGAHQNSIVGLINREDKDFLGRMGWTKKQARDKLYAFYRQVNEDARAMERWYTSVSGREGDR